MKFEEIAKYEEISWSQKSRRLWIKEGDINTKSFQRIINSHRRFSHIDNMEVEGAITDTKGIRKEILDFYQNIYAETETWRPNYNLIDRPCITEEEREWLQRDFDEYEVLESLKLCVADKAPGPDGYTVGSFYKWWEIVHEDLMKTIKNFHNN